MELLDLKLLGLDELLLRPLKVLILFKLYGLVSLRLALLLLHEFLDLLQGLPLLLVLGLNALLLLLDPRNPLLQLLLRIFLFLHICGINLSCICVHFCWAWRPSKNAQRC